MLKLPCYLCKDKKLRFFTCVFQTDSFFRSVPRGNSEFVYTLGVYLRLFPLFSLAAKKCPFLSSNSEKLWAWEPVVISVISFTSIKPFFARREKCWVWEKSSSWPSKVGSFSQFRYWPCPIVALQARFWEVSAKNTDYRFWHWKKKAFLPVVSVDQGLRNRARPTFGGGSLQHKCRAVELRLDRGEMLLQLM